MRCYPAFTPGIALLQKKAGPASGMKQAWSLDLLPRAPHASGEIFPPSTSFVPRLLLYKMQLMTKQMTRRSMRMMTTIIPVPNSAGCPQGDRPVQSPLVTRLPPASVRMCGSCFCGLPSFQQSGLLAAVYGLLHASSSTAANASARRREHDILHRICLQNTHQRRVRPYPRHQRRRATSVPVQEWRCTPR